MGNNKLAPNKILADDYSKRNEIYEFNSQNIDIMVL